MKSLYEIGRFGIQTKVLRQRIPLVASFKLTYRCNLRCAACPFHQRAAEEGSHMSWETACRSLEELHRMGCRFVIFEGGEPLLWQDADHDFSDLVGFAKKRFLSTGATTNGTYDLNVPTDVLWVSIDGVRERHNRLRSNSFDKIFSNIANSRHNRLHIHFTVNLENLEDIGRLPEIFAAYPQVRGITFQFFYPYEQGEDDLLLNENERRQAVGQILKLKDSRALNVLNSSGCLKAMVQNSWHCHDWMLANVDPDGRLSTGCYVKGRGAVRCEHCGFTPVAEASRAYDLRPGSIMAGWKIFLSAV